MPSPGPELSLGEHTSRPRPLTDRDGGTAAFMSRAVVELAQRARESPEGEGRARPLGIRHEVVLVHEEPFAITLEQAEIVWPPGHVEIVSPQEVDAGTARRPFAVVEIVAATARFQQIDAGAAVEEVRPLVSSQSVIASAADDVPDAGQHVAFRGGLAGTCLGEVDLHALG